MSSSQAASFLGVPAAWLKWLQAGAVGFVFCCFVADRHAMLEFAAEDRRMFREELQEQRRAMEKLARAVERLSAEVQVEFSRRTRPRE